jgi:hypothetical protein
VIRLWRGSDGTTSPRSNAVLLGWVAFWSGMSQEKNYPLLPTFVVIALGTSKAVVGLAESLLVVGVTAVRWPAHNSSTAKPRRSG